MTSERDKMLAGDLYRPLLDSELMAAQARAQGLMARVNSGDASALAGLLGEIGAESIIRPPFYCDYGTNIRIGAHVFINFNCTILDCAPVHIGDHVLIGPMVQIYTPWHPLDPNERRQGFEGAKPIRIGANAWIGGGAILCPGVTIGENAVIGAGSVVTRDVPANMVVAGNPARRMKEA